MPPKLKSIVVVGRQWHRPEIRVHVSKLEIKVEMDMADFLKALAKEAGNPTLLLTIPQLEARLTQAADKVVAGMKLETTRAIQ